MQSISVSSELLNSNQRFQSAIYENPASNFTILCLRSHRCLPACSGGTNSAPIDLVILFGPAELPAFHRQSQFEGTVESERLVKGMAVSRDDDEEVLEESR